MGVQYRIDWLICCVVYLFRKDSCTVYMPMSKIKTGSNAFHI
jgi:hypothetical protein